MTTTKTSFICPTLNSMKFIGYTIQSIVEVADEIIIVDGGSNDRTLDIVDSFGNSKVKVIEHNRDLNYSLQAGLDAATGNILIRLDDDWIWNKKIGRLRSLCNQGIGREKKGLECTFYNMISCTQYFSPTHIKHFILFDSEQDPVVCSGCYSTDNLALRHTSDAKRGFVKRKDWMWTPLKVGHWKMLKDSRQDFIEKWNKFRPEDDAVQKWEEIYSRPLRKAPKNLIEPLHMYRDRFVPLGGFDVTREEL